MEQPVPVSELPDVCELASSETDALKQRAAGGGFIVFELDGNQMRGKKELLAHLAAALNFPADFGANWDAAVDYLADMPSFHNAEKFLIIINHSAEIRRDAALFGELRQTLAFAALRARQIQGETPLKFILSY